MRVKVFCLLSVMAALVLTLSAFAQEGHPLTGVWYGDWGPSATHRNQITIIMEWNGKAVTGIIDPGPDAIPIKSATLDSKTWTVRIEAEAKNATGATVQYVAEGKLENIGSYNRTLTGTWSHGNTRGDFKITRD
jgi:hypothetical protein